MASVCGGERKRCTSYQVRTLRRKRRCCAAGRVGQSCQTESRRSSKGRFQVSPRARASRISARNALIQVRSSGSTRVRNAGAGPCRRSRFWRPTGCTAMPLASGCARGRRPRRETTVTPPVWPCRCRVETTSSEVRPLPMMSTRASRAMPSSRAVTSGFSITPGCCASAGFNGACRRGSALPVASTSRSAVSVWPCSVTVVTSLSDDHACTARSCSVRMVEPVAGQLAWRRTWSSR